MIVSALFVCIVHIVTTAPSNGACAGVPRATHSLEKSVHNPSLPDSSTVSADSRWGLIDTLIRWNPQRLNRASLEDVSWGRMTPNEPVYQEWQWAAHQLLRQIGLEFYDQHPNDSRRWTWLAAVLERDADHAFESDLDTIAGSAWRRRVPELTAALMASPNVREPAKAKIAFMQLRIRAIKLGLNNATKPNPAFPMIAREFIALAQRFPSGGEDDVREIADMLWWFCKRDSINGPQVLRALRASPNRDVHLCQATPYTMAAAL